MKGCCPLPPSRVRYAKGFSLIELMISLTIGLIMMAVVFYAYFGSLTAGRIAEAQGRMNEDAQAALSLLTQQLRMAGNNPTQPDRTENSRRNPVYNLYDAATFVNVPTTVYPSSFSIRGCDDSFNNITSATRLDALVCPTGTGYSPNSIAVSYEADIFNSVPTALKAPTDCLGSALASTQVTFPAENPPGPYFYSVADNRFYIDVSTANIPSLYCKGNGEGGTAKPLVENIEDLQFSYGVVKASTVAGDLETASISGYLRANEIMTNTTLTALPDDSARWAKVVAVRICVVARSEARVATDLISARYTKCDGNIEMSPLDLRLRHAYTTTVALRNRRL